jgi:enamine deaminase RidA (YjgF/YER057c/UK114 family)
MREATFSPLKRSAVLLGLLVALLGPPAQGDEARLSIGGYDPVAYFTDGKPVPGISQFEYLWHDARWRFASAAHRDLFAANPEHYAPQYDGYCAMGVAWKEPHKDTIDPQAWIIVDDKLYLTHTSRTMEERWRPNLAENIKRADANWSTVEHQPEPVTVGPPCRDQPPSVIVAITGGGRRVIVGGQVSRDTDGNVIGKGDMRAQIEQVSKNVQACLQAAGAKPSDIILIRAYVTDADAFKQNAEMRARYLGPESAPSAVSAVPNLAAGPDFLVEIEAVATLNSATSASAAPKQ